MFELYDSPYAETKYERLERNVSTYTVKTFLSNFIPVYRKSCSLNHIRIRFIESWKLKVRFIKFIGVVLKGLSKTFYCIPHDLLMAKMRAYGFSDDCLTFFYSYLKRSKQNVKIGNTYSVFQILLSDASQGSNLRPTLFNIFINNLYLSIKNSELRNFTDHKTIASAEDAIKTW